MPSPLDPGTPKKPLAEELPEPDAAPRPAPAPIARTPFDDADARLLTNASIQLRRGLTGEAEKAVREILEKRPHDAAAHEMLGDIRLTLGDWDGAGAAFKAALDSDPKRATAEAKMARATLRQGETQRVKELGVAYAGGDTALVGTGDKSEGKNAKLPLIGSLLLPGLGQMVNGQFVKGGIVMAIYFVGLALLYPHADELAGWFVPRKAQPSSPMLWFALIVLLADWVYSLADAVQRK